MIAYLSFYLLERPFLRIKDTLDRTKENPPAEAQKQVALENARAA